MLEVNSGAFTRAISFYAPDRDLIIADGIYMVERVLMVFVPVVKVDTLEFNLL